jgi:hypothetical protein
MKGAMIMSYGEKRERPREEIKRQERLKPQREREE